MYYQVVYGDEKLTPKSGPGGNSDIMTRLDTVESIITCDETIQFELADNIPKSTIVYDENDDLETKALKLCQKYINIGSDFEINIGSGIRAQLSQRFQQQSIGYQQRITHAFQRKRSGSIAKNNASSNAAQMGNMIRGNSESNQAANDLLTVFDDCCATLVRLLAFSLSRFKTKPEFLKVQNYQTGK